MSAACILLPGHHVSLHESWQSAKFHAELSSQGVSSCVFSILLWLLIPAPALSVHELWHLKAVSFVSTAMLQLFGTDFVCICGYAKASDMLLYLC